MKEKNKTKKENPIKAPNDVLEEFKIQDGIIHTKFDLIEFLDKDECTSYNFGKVPIEQKGYICLVCDKKKKNFMCHFCHKFCHEKCRGTLIEDIKVVEKKEKFGLQKFACHCGVEHKHIVALNEKLDKTNCNMMQLDHELKITPYHCITHDIIVCCICAVVCHKECTIVPELDANSTYNCDCISDSHSNFNEMGLSFPLEQYKKIGNIDIWPIQILNILFSTGTIFNNMKIFFNKILSNEIDVKTQKKSVIQKFADLLELFANTFNSNFKTYYYHEEITSIFPYQKLFNFIRNLEVNNDSTCIIKFRLLFILLFVHLRKDYQVYKSLTSNDFLCNNVLQRLALKKLYRCNNIFNNSINDKYKILNGDPIKDFALKELCNLIKNGMKYISIEENQDEFEIGLKILCFMLKRLMFNKEDLILLINSLFNFHEKFYEYLMISKKNIYSLLDIINAIIEICYMISVYYNDLVIEESLENNNDTNKNTSFGKLIITKSEHSNKLLTIIFKNCDLFSKHFDLLIKPELDIKSKEEKKREKKLRKHLLIMQQKILSKTTGVTQKIPENGGILNNKVITLFNENLALFSLTDNLYQKQLEYITEEDFKDYNKFCNKIEDEDFYKIMNITSNQEHSNILLNLKIVLEESYFDLFTTSYSQQKDQFEKQLRTRILNACDKIKNNIESFLNNSYYSKLIQNLKEEEEKLIKDKEENRDYMILDDDELIKRRILKDISVNINFATSQLLLIEEGRELIVDNLIISQIDETLFKGLNFMTNIRFPNIISHELIRLFFHFLGLFLLTKRGTRYILMGKTLKNIKRLINRFRYDGKNKNIAETKGRSTFFNVNSIKVVIHYLCLLTKFIKIYNIKTITMHKALIGLQKNIITHIKYYSNNIDNEDSQIEFKQQLKECLEIFNNLFEYYTYNEFEYIKFDFIDVFKNCPMKLLNPEFFQKWFDRATIDFEDPNFKKRRKWDLAFYFQFFELITKNTFYVYENDVYGQKLIGWLKTFIDIDNIYHLLLNSNELFSFYQKTILLKFIRTYYFIDYLNQVNYLKKKNLLTTEQYKSMISNNLIKDNRVTQYLIDTKNKKNKKSNEKDIKNNKSKNNTIDKENLKSYGNKYEYINELIILIKIYSDEIDKFPNSIVKETNKTIKNYIIEFIFATHELSTNIYYNDDIINKVLPYYYKLVVIFLKKKNIFLKILKDIEKITKIIPDNYNYLLNEDNINEDYIFFKNRAFNMFDKDYIYKYIIKNIFDIYKQTNINKEYNLEKFLKIYDLFNEANFPPFSLLEVKDYEYFYEEQDENEDEKKEISEDYEKFNSIRDCFNEQYKDITQSAFLGIASGESTNKKVDYAEKYVHLFKSFINSTNSTNLTNYRTLLCIMVKLLLYNGEHIQDLIKDYIKDKYFFNNLNRELNYHIVQCINSSKKYELFYGATKITDITKLTIQFLQLLGEGFNTNFHNNILKGVNKKIINKNEDDKEENKDEEKKENESEDSDSDSQSIDFEINEEIVEKAINMSVKNELNKRRVIPLIDTNLTIYESMIYNLKTIYHLMSLNLLVEGELAYDKLCILSTNIIDFIIEFINTKKELIYIIDYSIKNLFFGKDKKSMSKNVDLNKKGVASVLTLKINDDDEDNIEQYKLRKTMVTFMKIKYYQLVKAYLQIGNKNEFIHLMISNRMGPFQLFGEIIYYMKELINNLMSKNYDKYNYLLNVDNIDSYKKKLIKLYIFDTDFSTSIEMSAIFQICLILATFEDIYKITTLRDFFSKSGNITEYNKKTNDEEDLNSTIESKEEDVITIEDNSPKKYTAVPSLNLSKVNDYPLFYSPETGRSDNNLIEDLGVETKDLDENKFNYSRNKPVYQQIDDTPYSRLKENYENCKNKNKQKKNQKKKVFSNDDKKKIKLDEDYLNLDSKFVKAIYNFLYSLISRVEVKMELNDENVSSSNKKRNNIYHFLSNKISKEFIKLKNESKKLTRIIDDNTILNNNESNYENNFETNDEKKDNNGNQLSFFIRPHLSFLLSQQTKDYFINNVDRSHIQNKYSSLISFSDYCIFEMMYNYKYIYNSKIKKQLSQIDLYYIQIINYVLILAENALLMYHYYRPTSLSREQYDVVDPNVVNQRFTDIFIIIIVKLCLIVFVLFVWFYCKFIITYQRNIIFKEESNFIFRTRGNSDQNINQPIMVNYFQNDGSLLEIMGLINQDLNVLNKIKIVLFDSIIANMEINIFVFSFILNILFLLHGSPIFLSIETIFLVGIFPSLLNIFKAFTTNFSSLISCLIFIYFVIYIYNWLAIFNLRDTFDFGDIFDYKSAQYSTEPFCHSSLQCYMVLINYGTRSGGGIADNIPLVSFKKDINMFIARFFYDMTFFILVIMIMGNITFGLIVDSFGALRNITYAYEIDKKDRCFICRLTRDGALFKNIDFDDHVNNEHNIWNYVDYLCYLHLYDANNFSRVEGFVWDKLIEKDYGWIPNNDDKGGEDEEEE